MYGWRETWKGDAPKATDAYVQEFLKTVTLWLDWHSKIYSRKEELTFEAMYKAELTIGIDYKKALVSKPAPPK